MRPAISSDKHCCWFCVFLLVSVLYSKNTFSNVSEKLLHYYEKTFKIFNFLLQMSRQHENTLILISYIKNTANYLLAVFPKMNSLEFAII